MGTRDPCVDAYIDRSADFAKPILTHLREVVHGACPDVEESIKWNFPVFLYHGLLANMAGFRQHCTFGFWKGSLIVAEKRKAGDAMGQFGRITALKDLPPKRQLTALVREAMRLNEQGIKAPKKAKAASLRRVAVPTDLAAALKKDGAARSTFQAFSSSNKREYVEWLEEARTDATRTRRLATAVEWMAEGKPRNWKYMKDG